MKVSLFFAICVFGLSLELKAQNDTIPAANLLDDLTSSDTTSMALLPSKIIFTQRILWGQRGLMRNFKTFELTPENRQIELKIRRTMLVSHQVMGFATLGAMIAQGIVGSQLYNGNYNLKDAHEALAIGINVGYFYTASMSLFAPPKMLNERKGYSSIKLHRILAIIHLTGMLTTDILSTQLEAHPELRPYHRAAAFTTLGALTAAMVVIKF